MVNIYIRIPIFFFFAFPVRRLTKVYDIIPMVIPSDILYARGIAIIVRNAGIPSAAYSRQNSSKYLLCFS